MKSRVHPTYKTKYHVQNWAAYDRALVRRGDITIWVSPAAIAAWEPEGPRTRGAQRKCSDLAIQTALTLRLLFHLPLRQAEGFLASLFVLMGLDLRSPDHTTLSRRGQHLDCTLRRVPTRAGLHLIIDSTGLSIVGQGEWAAAQYGHRGTRRASAHLVVQDSFEGRILWEDYRNIEWRESGAVKDLVRDLHEAITANEVLPRRSKVPGKTNARLEESRASLEPKEPLASQVSGARGTDTCSEDVRARY